MKSKILLISLLLALGIGYLIFTIVTKPDNNQSLNDNGVPTSGDTAQSGSPNGELAIEPAALIVRKDLAMRLGIDEDNITILEIVDKMWSNGCLGLEQRGEMCTAALVSGFHIRLVVDANEYTYRTNKDGTVFRAESGPTKTGEVSR